MKVLFPWKPEGFNQYTNPRRGGSISLVRDLVKTYKHIPQENCLAS
jgi:hypothetical protein